MTDDTFGFATAKPSIADRLKSIRPADAGAAPAAGDIARADAAGLRVGFQSRESGGGAPVVHRRKKELGPTTAINTRAPQRVAVPFIAFCEENRFSYWEGIEDLMRRAGLLD
jgi:hypothetical protein